MKKKEYNIAMIGIDDAAEVLRALNQYGKAGWTFVSWIENGPRISKKLPYLKYAIFVRDLD